MKTTEIQLIRTFGPDKGYLSDSESILMELEKSESTLDIILQEIAQLRREVQEIPKLREEVREVAKLRREVKDFTLFKGDIESLSIRAFSDAVLNSFLRKAGQAIQKPYARHIWLMGPACAVYCKNHTGESFFVRGKEITINVELIWKFKALKRASSSLSLNTCHSTSAVKIAVAIDNQVLMASVTNRVDAFKSLFVAIFNVNPGDLAQRFRLSEQIDNNLLVGFKVMKI